MRTFSIALSSTINSLTSNELPVFFIAQLQQSIQTAQKGDLITISWQISGPHPNFDQLQLGLSIIYVQAEKIKVTTNKFLLDITVLIEGFSQAFRTPPPNYKLRTVALGGTFDHLHSGHKILLTMAAWLATHKLIVGISDGDLLVNKKFPQRLQSLSERIAAVTTFLKRVSPLKLIIEPVVLKDIYGPTATEPDIQGILVSKETFSGTKAINEKRHEKGLMPLEPYVIDMISPDKINLNEADIQKLKISSTELRKWLDDGGE
ncbi:hypothetical protein O181_095705 [Austropuccinia psidii MF-1]|uniref:Cytidyltransferase-like domain-containing protein n=1 Tax=Austropuccinia psidii MF-1 TaxID=1389203 RepID=A0A9Q3J4B6_9BASI|nr:hypothetical protein [Austropuccinia psidii MF-1]